MLFQLVKPQATAQLNSDASSRQQQLKKLERGVTEGAEIADQKQTMNFAAGNQENTGQSYHWLFFICILPAAPFELQ